MTVQDPHFRDSTFLIQKKHNEKVLILKMVSCGKNLNIPHICYQLARY